MNKNMDRRMFLQHMGLSSAAMLTLGMAGKTPKVEIPKKKPNVLFFVSDDLRPDLGCYGNKIMQSPNIDQLAARGTVFNRAYCQVAVCNPSRISFLSGLRPDTTGVVDNYGYLRDNLPDVVTLPQLFKNNGYTALSIGKVFHQHRGKGSDEVAWSESPFGHSKGYRHWYNKDSMEVIKNLRKQGKRPRGPSYECSDQPDNAYPDGKTADRAIETLRRVKDEPFFLGVGFIKPHLPLTCPKKYWDMYPAETIKMPENYYRTKNAPEAAFHNWYELRSYSDTPKEGEITKEQALNLIRGYRACVSFLDAQIGRVLDELDRLGLRENTIVVVLGDHGYHLGENHVWTKMTNFELGTHAPLIISAPGQKAAGKTSDALVEFVDVYPTVAELCGLKAPDTLEGLSLAPLLQKPKLSWKKAAFSQYPRGTNSQYKPERGDLMGRSIRTDRYRYTEWKSQEGKIVGVELYDQKKDPENNVNIAGEPGKKELTAKLSKQLNDGWKAAKPSSKKSRRR